MCTRLSEYSAPKSVELNWKGSQAALEAHESHTSGIYRRFVDVQSLLSLPLLQLQELLGLFDLQTGHHRIRGGDSGLNGSRNALDCP